MTNPAHGVVYGLIFVGVFYLMVWMVAWAGTHNNIWAGGLAIALAVWSGIAIVRTTKRN